MSDRVVDTRVWDLVVVGGGTAGIVAAKTAVRLGASTVLIERHRTGGDCLWTGCVPSKALLAAATAAANARRAGRFGVDAGPVRVDFGRVMDHVRSTIAHIAPVDSVEALEADGVQVLSAKARFTGPGMLDVNGQALRFRQAILATVPRPPFRASSAWTGRHT